MKQCVTCLEFKDDSDFNWRFKSLGQRHKICRDCQNNHSRNWYKRHKEEHAQRVKDNRYRVKQETREYAWDYLSTHPCIECGESDPTVLEFDHIHGKDKDIAVLVGQGYSIKAVMKEIAKCQVLCANCHRRKTAKERGWFRKD